MDDLEKKPSECLFEKKICSSENDLKLMKEFLTTNENDEMELIKLMKKKLNVSTEAKIWENQQFKNFVGDRKAEFILKNKFKPIGPNDSTALLDNYNIDETLRQYQNHSDTLFNRKFYHIPFQMIDFDQTGTELSTFSIGDVIKNKFDCFGVVLNTDISSNRGKHWFCLFGDLKHRGTKDDPYTLEYFNSSGNQPMNQVEIFMKRSTYNLLKEEGKICEIIRSAPRRLQYSSTECGVWSLMYIRSRLMGYSSKYFYDISANDKDMIAMRAHFFRSKN